MNNEQLKATKASITTLDSPTGWKSSSKKIFQQRRLIKTTTNRGAERISLSKAKAAPSTGHRGEAATKKTNKQTNNYPVANETDEES